jgi:hypothetical protein
MFESSGSGQDRTREPFNTDIVYFGGQEISSSVFTLLWLMVYVCVCVSSNNSIANWSILTKLGISVTAFGVKISGFGASDVI